MKLVIVESPAKTKTISKYLGKGYSVMASIGHVRDLPKSNKDAIDIAGGFVPRYVILEDKEKVVRDIAASAKKASEVLLATDPDREGEAIAWHVAQAAHIKHPKRIVFHEITKEAVESALEYPRAIDMNLLKAQEARRVLDRLVGYDLSGLIWKKVRYGLSAGRVQSPALRILVEREREIKAFKPEDFWVITALVETMRGEQFTVISSEEPRSVDETERILRVGRSAVWSVADVSESEGNRLPRAPFITSTLQQAASSRLGFAPSRTMRTAQRLYEAGLITYMRTDSTTLAAVAQQQIAEIVRQKYGASYVSPRQYKTKSKNAQEAHEAIRPTDISRTDAGGTPEQKKLYELIWRRTAASQMAPARIMRTKITVNAFPAERESAVPDFFANGSRTLFDGWLKADPRAKGEDVELPKVAPQDSLALKNIESEAKQTQPPPRYSEAGLVKELEKRGIGRPSTYASIIKTLYDRAYVEKFPPPTGKALKPTDTGEIVSGFLEKNFTEYISDTFTAEMEDELDEIAIGKREYVKTLKEFYDQFKKAVGVRAREAEKITDLGPAPAEFLCPVCGGTMIWKLGKSGKFMSCARFPECNGARAQAGEAMEAPKETGEKCPECGHPLVGRHGKYGPFVACSNYPKCKYIKQDKALEMQKSSGVKCPVCGEGEMVERRGRFGIFYSCSNYPKCKYAIKAKPTGAVCSICGSLMMEGTKTIPERCSKKECPNHRTGKEN